MADTAATPTPHRRLPDVEPLPPMSLSYLSPKGLAHYAEACGLTLARAHARSGYRISMAAYLGETTEFDEAMASFAADYAVTNASDHAALVEAIDNGRLPALREE